LSSESCSVKHHRQDYPMKSDDCTAGGNVTVAKHKVACKQCKVSQANAQWQASCVVGSWIRTRNYADVKCVRHAKETHRMFFRNYKRIDKRHSSFTSATCKNHHIS